MRNILIIHKIPFFANFHKTAHISNTTCFDPKPSFFAFTLWIIMWIKRWSKREVASSLLVWCSRSGLLPNLFDHIVTAPGRLRQSIAWLSLAQLWLSLKVSYHFVCFLITLFLICPCLPKFMAIVVSPKGRFWVGTANPICLRTRPCTSA